MAWGGINRAVRNMTRTALAHRPAVPSADLAKPLGSLLGLMQGTGHVLRSHIRKISDSTWPEVDTELASKLGTCMDEDVIDRVMQAPHMPLHIVYEMSTCVESMLRAGVLDKQIIKMGHYLDEISLSIATCERLVVTPMPTSYTRQTSVFLTLWLSGLPCVLYPAFGDATAVVAMGMSFAILGLEDVGVQMEQPFYVLSMSTWAAGIENSVTYLKKSHLLIHGETTQ